MRTLILMRHSDAADISEDNFSDYARNLTPGGRLKAAQQANLLKKFRLDSIFASSALRTAETAAVVASFLERPIQIALKPELYQTTIERHLTVLQQLPETLSTVLLISHNPAISHLSEWLSGAQRINLAPAGFCILQAPLDQLWATQSGFQIISQH